MKTSSPEAYSLLHQGAITLSQIEANGIRIDTDYLDRAISKTEKKIKHLENGLRHDEIYTTWKKTYGAKTKIGSREQLGHILFDIMKHPCTERTKTGRPKADAKALDALDLEVVKVFTRLEHLKKTKTTSLEGIRREVVDGLLHPFYHLHTVASVRSSSSDPNFQNFPARDQELGKLVRSCFIARDGHILVENDFKAIEVCVAACYNHDPVLIDYIKDPSKDMHGDMAAEVYKLKPANVNKQTRYTAKNRFVFPEFYGSYYLDCSKHLWDAIDTYRLSLPNGTSIKDHLASKGIEELGDCNYDTGPAVGTFEHHIKKVEEDFWGRRFKVYAAWKKRWYEQYLKEGGFDTLTGFRIDGVYKRNQVVNYPIQGSAFHCLLWTLIQLNRWLTKHHMRTKIVGQIHDSIVADVYEQEKDDYLAKVKQIVTVDLPKHWKWIIVPMTVEAEVCPPGGSWYDKKEVKF